MSTFGYQGCHWLYGCQILDESLFLILFILCFKSAITSSSHLCLFLWQEDDEETPGYKAPAKVDLATIQQLDADDEALVKYKQALLGQTENVVGT